MKNILKKILNKKKPKKVVKKKAKTIKKIAKPKKVTKLIKVKTAREMYEETTIKILSAEAINVTAINITLRSILSKK